MKSSENRQPRLPRCGVVAAALMMLIGPQLALAQDNGDTEIIARVTFTQEQFDQFTDQMLQVAELLGQNEPETAEILREAVRQAREAFISEDMGQVAEKLREGMTAMAASEQAEVIERLRQLLVFLRSGPLDLDERNRRLERWTEQLEQINQFLARQRELAQRAHLTANADELAEQIAALRERLAGAVRRQQELLEQTRAEAEAAGDSPLAELADMHNALQAIQARQDQLARSVSQLGIDKLPLLAAAQAALAQRAAELAEQMAAAADDEAVAEAIEQAEADPQMLAGAREATERAIGAMNAAAEALEVPNAAEGANEQQNAAADLAEAADALGELLRQAGADTTSTQLSQQQGELADEAADLAQALEDLAEQAGRTARSDNLAGAAEQMSEASQRLADQQPGQATENQEEALRLMQDQDERLAQLNDRIQEQAERPMEEQEAEQSELAEETGRLGENMAGDDSNEATPGQQNVANAGESMEQASESMGGEGSPSDQASQAGQQQEQAIDELEQAREDLAEAVAREREMLEAEKLAKIDKLLQDILDGQKTISIATADVHDARNDDETYEREQQLRLGELSRGEGELAGEVEAVKTILEDDGSTAVFPQILDEVTAQLRILEQRLADRQAGPITQSVQGDVEEMLAELIASIREELAERRQQQGGGGGQQPGGMPQPLVSSIAELKMLWRMQRRIAAKTVELDAESSDLTDEQAEVRHRHLAERQQELERITRELQETMDRAE